MDLHPVRMTFGRTGTYFVPYHLVAQYNWLDKNEDCRRWKACLDFPEVDEEIGHTIVHYLYTKKYQTLKPKDGSQKYKNHTQYCYSVLVCGVARKYGLAELRKMAEQEMDQRSINMTPNLILEAARDVYGGLRSDVSWFEVYTSEKVKAAYTNARLYSHPSLTKLTGAKHFTNLVSGSEPFNRFLVHLMAELLMSFEEDLISSKQKLQAWTATENDVLRKAISQLPVALESSPIDSLDGLKCDSEGKIHNTNGDVIGELIEGDAKKCSRFTCDWSGEIRDKKCNVIGKAKTAATAVKAPPAPEPEPEPAPSTEAVFETLPISILRGLPVNKEGRITDENGTVVGELIEGDAGRISRFNYTCNMDGEVIDKFNKIIGRAQSLPVPIAAPPPPLPHLPPPGEEMKEEPVPEAVVKVSPEEATPEIPPTVEPGTEIPDLSTLKSLKLNEDGKVVNEDSVIVAELVSGDVSRIRRLGLSLNGHGQFLNSKKKEIGRVMALPIAKAASEPEPVAEATAATDELVTSWATPVTASSKKDKKKKKKGAFEEFPIPLPPPEAPSEKIDWFENVWTDKKDAKAKTGVELDPLFDWGDDAVMKPTSVDEPKDDGEYYLGFWNIEKKDKKEKSSKDELVEVEDERAVQEPVASDVPEESATVVNDFPEESWSLVQPEASAEQA